MECNVNSWSRSRNLWYSRPLGSPCDMVEHDLVASEDQARRDRPSFGAGDDDPVVAAEAIRPRPMKSSGSGSCGRVEFAGRRRRRGRGWSSRGFRARAGSRRFALVREPARRMRHRRLAIRKLQPPYPPCASSARATRAASSGRSSVEQYHGEQSSGTNLIGPGELAIMAVGDRHGHAGLVDAEPGSHRGERAVRAMIGAGQQTAHPALLGSRRATWSGAGAILRGWHRS